MNRVIHLSVSVRLLLVLCLLGSLNAFAAPSTTVADLYSIRINGNKVYIQNVSDRTLTMQLTIEGNNFLSQVPCQSRVFLAPHREVTMDVAAKNKTEPPDYRILVTEFSAKTDEQLRSEQQGKPLPLPPTPITPERAAKVTRLTCQSH